MKNQNKNLHSAKKNKNDEFYTQLNDISNELKHYKHHFENKVVYCNCDDPRISNFFQYFSLNFESLKLKKLITACYKNNNADEFNFEGEEKENAIYLQYKRDGQEHLIPYPQYMEKLKQIPKYKDPNNPNVPQPEDIGIGIFKGDGDFRKEESIELLQKTDIVVTNPPFSLFREYVEQLIKYNKKFLIIGNMNAITYKEIFKLIKDNKLWLGCNSVKEFRQPDDTIKKMGNVIWYTNLLHKKRNEKIYLFEEYQEKKYPKYDNYDAINVDKVHEIPEDYDGVMGVPISFLDKYNPEQFEIIKFRKGNDEKDLSINGKCPYFRVLIKRKK